MTRGKTSERRDALVQIAAELFAERGYRATTVRHIGVAAGVLSGSLYHHFDSKESILDELLSSYLAELLGTYRGIASAGGSPADTLRELVRASFRSLAEHRAAITVLQNERNHLRTLSRFDYLTESEEEIRRIWSTVLRDGIAAGDFRADLDPVVTYRFLRDSVWVTVRWFRSDGRLPADRFADQYLSLIFDGLTSGRRPVGLTEGD
jgi:TetR/AcrR family transcriptional regulator, cholesterol catabolism regulator